MLGKFLIFQQRQEQSKDGLYYVLRWVLKQRRYGGRQPEKSDLNPSIHE